MTTVAAAAVSPSVVDGFPLAIQTEGLTRRFGQHVAVDQVSLTVPQGAVYGFLGPNGSGKTTTIRLLLGLMNAHGGSISLLGGTMPQDAARVLPRVGTLVEGPAFHPYLTGQDNLRRLDAYDASTDPATSAQRIAHALERVGLGAAARKNFRRYSLGMKQRLGLAAALLRPRDLLILDEPTNGLDPQGTREVRSLIRELAADGSTVLVSSHLLAEIEQVATHVGIMSAGKLLRQGPLAEVIGTATSLLRIDTTDPSLAVSVLEGLGLSIGERTADHVSVVSPSVPPERVNAALVTAGVPVRGLVVERPTLEDLFVSLTGEGFDVVR
ncbi:MAG: type transport system ATP-binding protein [Frankiales bacterium]|nr:type transport system ATP-binding protein [Frankiales bacterium]MDX6212114.1 type transport system ATP-binding protein [Frankiales bacterium]